MHKTRKRIMFAIIMLSFAIANQIHAMKKKEKKSKPNRYIDTSFLEKNSKNANSNKAINSSSQTTFYNQNSKHMRKKPQSPHTLASPTDLVKLWDSQKELLKKMLLEEIKVPLYISLLEEMRVGSSPTIKATERGKLKISRKATPPYCDIE